jgi:drug/metabolite transporter (DMT)-like permease
MSTDHRRGILWALGASFGIAGFVVPWKMANALGDQSINTLVLLVAAAGFNTILTAVGRGAIFRVSKFDFGLALVLAVCTLAGNLASAEAIARLSPSVLTVVQRSEVIFVALLAWPIVGERIDGRFIVGALIAGIGLLVLQDPFAATPPSPAGVAWAIASAFFFSSMAVLTRKFIHRIHPISVNGLRLWLSVALWFLFNELPDGSGEVSTAQISYAALAGFFGPFIGRLCTMTSAKYIEARLTTLVLLTAPPFALLVSFLVLDDLPSAREIQGGLLMLVGIAVPMSSWRRRRNHGSE